MMDACDEYFTKMSCEKLESNLKFYRSLNTRKGPSKYLDKRVHDCMVSYSAATTNNSVGRVSISALNKVFNKDRQKLARQKERSSMKSNSRLTRTTSCLSSLPTIKQRYWQIKVCFLFYLQLFLCQLWLYQVSTVLLQTGNTYHN